jgi:hypothetical protein
MFGTLGMTLITKAPAGLNADRLDFVVRKFAQNFIATPRTLGFFE